MELPSIGVVLLAGAAVIVGAFVQGSIGFGFALVVVPAIALVRPGAVPVTLLFLALPMALWMALRERGAIDMAGFVEISIGRVLGTAGGVWILATVTTDQLSVVIGSSLVLAVILSFANPAFEAGSKSRFFAGALSGLMGTSAAIGGPPLALAYQKRSGSELRSTLAISFVVGAIISLAALAAAGQVEGWHALFALELAPGLAVGLFAAVRLSRRLDGVWLRPLVLAFAGISGVATAVRALL